jgi:hypothetical protein
MISLHELLVGDNTQQGQLPGLCWSCDQQIQLAILTFIMISLHQLLVGDNTQQEQEHGYDLCGENSISVH